MTRSSARNASPTHEAELHRLGAFGGWTIALVAAAVLAQVVLTVAAWWTYGSMASHRTSGALLVDREKLWASIASTVGLVTFVATMTAGIIFTIWLWRVRRNSEILCAAHHRLPIGWVIGGWLCPIVNLWFPALILTDVLRASDPRTPSDARDLRGRPVSALVVLWWVAWLATLALQSAARLRSDYNNAFNPEISSG